MDKPCFRPQRSYIPCPCCLPPRNEGRSKKDSGLLATRALQRLSFHDEDWCKCRSSVSQVRSWTSTSHKTCIAQHNEGDDGRRRKKATSSNFHSLMCSLHDGFPSHSLLATASDACFRMFAPFRVTSFATRTTHALCQRPICHV